MDAWLYLTGALMTVSDLTFVYLSLNSPHYHLERNALGFQVFCALHLSRSVMRFALISTARSKELIVAFDYLLPEHMGAGV